MLLPLPSTCYNMFSIEMINPNYMTHLDHVVRIIITWSEWRESNPRPHGPERSGMKKAEYLEFLETVRLRNTHSLTKCENFLNMLKRTPTACSRK